MKNFVKFLSAAAVVAVLLTGCEKEQATAPESNTTSEVVNSGYSNTPAVIDGKSYVFEHTVSAVDKKGVYGDHTNGFYKLKVVQGQAKVLNSMKTYTTIKVKRSESPGDYFYIMCENLDIDGTNNSNYLAYNYSAINREKHGLLYDWNEASLLASKVYMDLPLVYEGEEYPDYLSTCYAQLPTFADIQSLLGTSIGHLPTNGTAPTSGRIYYDSFVGGPGANGSVGADYALNKTLVGFANNMDLYPQRFFAMGKETQMWTSVSGSGSAVDFAYPLSITRQSVDKVIYNYIAYINVAQHKRYGLVVRYVFRPEVY